MYVTCNLTAKTKVPNLKLQTHCLKVYLPTYTKFQMYRRFRKHRRVQLELTLG